MKIKKEDLRDNIEQLIGEGVINAEEIEVTTDKVLRLVWPLIDYLQRKGENNADSGGGNHPCPSIKKLLNETDAFYCHSWDNDDLRCKKQCDKCKDWELIALDHCR